MAFDILVAGKLLKNRREISKNIFHAGWSKGAIAGLIAASELYQKKSALAEGREAAEEYRQVEGQKELGRVGLCLQDLREDRLHYI